MVTAFCAIFFNVEEILDIQIDHPAPGVRVVRLAGPLTLKTLFEFQQKARDESDHAIILDLSGVPYADSAGLGAMLGVLASCQRQAKGFAVAAPGERVQTLFRLTRIDGLVRTHSTVDEAVQELQKRSAK